VFPDLFFEVAGGIIPGCPARPCPWLTSADDPGTQVVNYRGEPVGLRVFDPERVAPDGKKGMQAAGLAGDLAFALQSRTDRAIARLNKQPQAGESVNGTIFPPPINAGGVGHGDPFTPMLRAFAGDLVRIKTEAGAHEEEHSMSVHGVKWLQGGSGHGTGPNTGWRNAQANAISEQFTLKVPVVPVEGATGRPFIDYAYSVDASNDGWWSGTWGILKAHEDDQPGLFRLPTTIAPLKLTQETKNAFTGVCPSNAPVRKFDVTAVLANKVLPPNADVNIQDHFPNGHVGAAPAGNGRTLVYNPRTATVGGQTVVDEDGSSSTLPQNRGPIHDPTAMLYVLTSDLTPAPTTKQEQDACKKGVTNLACPVVLAADRPIEPLVLRAKAGECIETTLRNRLPADAPELASLNTILGIVKRDRFDPRGSTTFQPNLVQTSSFAGLHPQLVAYDVSRADGTIVGNNEFNTNDTNKGGVAGPGMYTVVRWYAGDLTATRANGAFSLTPTPIEFGGANLQPADKIKQGAKSLVGALVIEPQNASWKEDTLVLDRQDGQGTRQTRTQATVCPAGEASCTLDAPGAFRDFSVVLTKSNTQYYADSKPVQHLEGMGVEGVPEDTEDTTTMALNYGIEPMWFRFGLAPHAPFGNTDGGYGGVADAHRAFSNALTGGQDPVTPVLIAKAGKEARIHLTVPYGTNFGMTANVHGHVWGRQPYVCPGSNRDGLPGACKMDEVGSRAIGPNPYDMYVGGLESIAPATHFTLRFPIAGGGNAVTGDYLFRDQGGYGTAGGLWGIMRVE
jgi:hypothetical protein